MNLIERIKNTQHTRRAVYSRGEWYSYGKLHSLILKFSSFIKSINVKRVILSRDDDIEFIVALLGCINNKTGVLIVSPKHSQETLTRLIIEFNSDEVISCDFNINDIETFEEDISIENINDSRFYLCTSGTTGLIKLVEHTGESLLYTGLQFNSIIELTGDDILFSAAKMTHAFGLGNSISLPLSNGASVILNDSMPVKHTINSICKTHRPTIICGVPRHLIVLTQIKYNGIRAILSAGEQLPTPLLHQLQQIFNCDVIDAIGSTEVLGFYLQKKGHLYDTINGCEYKLLNNINGVAELVVRSPYSSIGYTNNIFADKWILTGDLVRRVNDSFIFEGRKNDRVKVNGMYVHLNEIDKEIESIHGVELCTSTYDVDELNRTRIKIFVKLNDESIKPIINQLIKNKQHLHDIPYKVLTVSEIPVTLTGKKQRFMLANLDK